MFKENKSHLQTELFNTTTLMHPRTTAQLKKSWAPIYYEHVFCKIDEKKIAPLYCPDNGSPNKPVNILLSLEFIKCPCLMQKPGKKEAIMVPLILLRRSLCP
ncbi:hypothetical protein MGLY_30730 [Neomoorella glycerini]|uniref:Uncharacterized protein n=1 Tax=Neomoorella glycerini TaxID=55779 RepID=A0A6I5ZUF7_9FIRM|nr:hypothetical protein [Moorella glycerini]QGP93653.1 hypothetical protein MGLY_30730 [Moorella glycerini]